MLLIVVVSVLGGLGLAFLIDREARRLAARRNFEKTFGEIRRMQVQMRITLQDSLTPALMKAARAAAELGRALDQIPPKDKP